MLIEREKEDSSCCSKLGVMRRTVRSEGELKLL